MRIPLTKLAHDLIADSLKPGDLAVDATVGNGHDTLFLAQRVGDTGQVLGLDVQDAAIRVTRQRLVQVGLEGRVTLLRQGHQHLDSVLPASMRGRLNAVMFNLGYLPGGNQNLITRSESTLPALQAAYDHLAEDGLISLMVYRGHEGGESEYAAIKRWLKESRCSHEFPDCGERPANAPVLLHIRH